MEFCPHKLKCIKWSKWISDYTFRQLINSIKKFLVIIVIFSDVNGYYRNNKKVKALLILALSTYISQNKSGALIFFLLKCNGNITMRGLRAT